MCQICSATFLDYQDYFLIKSCTIVLSNLFRYFFVYQDHFLIKSCMNILSNLFRYFCDYQDYFLKKIMDDALFFVIKIFFEKIIYYCSIKFVSCMIKYFDKIIPGDSSWAHETIQLSISLNSPNQRKWYNTVQIM